MERVVRKRCNDGISRILHVKDEISYLAEGDSSALRRVVLREFNGLADMCSDLLQVQGPAEGLNDLFLRKIEEIHRALVR